MVNQVFEGELYLFPLHVLENHCLYFSNSLKSNRFTIFFPNVYNFSA